MLQACTDDRLHTLILAEPAEPFEGRWAPCSTAAAGVERLGGVDDLARRWPLPDQPTLRDRLLSAYADPGRGYHDLRHLTEVLDHLDVLFAQPAAAASDPDAVVLAAWFHDAVYEGTTEDEEQSARLAEVSLAACGTDAGTTAEVARLVRLTRDHAPGDDDVHGQVLCDADLAILAAAPERYAEYTRDVRAEYAHLDDAAFSAGRVKVLQALLDKPTLFHTPLARSRWERPARANVAGEVAHIRSNG
jgi:predicted metal-dependent HD superfamily phosphohydrolase